MIKARDWDEDVPDLDSSSTPTAMLAAPVKQLRAHGFHSSTDALVWQIRVRPSFESIRLADALVNVRDKILMRCQSTDESNYSTSIHPSSLVMKSTNCCNEDEDGAVHTTIVRRVGSLPLFQRARLRAPHS
jgi:hypothetical protein